MTMRNYRPGIARRIPVLAMGLCAAITGVSAIPASADPLSALRWKSRVLVLVAQNPGDAELRTQRAYLEQASSGMFERNVVLMEAVGDSERARELRKRLATDVSDFRVMLVGKDGNTAFASDAPLAARDIFGRIDQMPMRKEEIRKTGG
ncbi:DUF4174 domain-containing protein [Tardiphaga alba]|nr:DUF4174 domain-containing protein [Tardiphaga alba]